uniref:Amino acid transporter n=1 Tax=Riptortus pedestris TaxID=329032 RepID=R4WDJ0_RIPPE|nr:amino acid transporter [Riptortus pedestris]
MCMVRCMRRFSVQKSVETTENSTNRDAPRKISMPDPSALKFRKMSIDQKNGMPVEINNNNIRKESLKSISVKEPQITEKEYDPYDHRDVKHSNSFAGTLTHLLKGSMGTGILAMPYAFSNAGYILGTFGTIFMGALCTYAIHILISSAYELCKRTKVPSMSYPETARAALAHGPKQFRSLSKYAPHACNVMLVSFLVGSAGIYIVFISSNLKDVIDHYQDPKDQWELRWYCLIILGPLILLNLIRRFKYLVPLSLLATVLTSISFVIVFYYVFSDIPDLSKRTPIAPVGKIPLFLATVIFAMEAIGVVLPLENEMKNPKQFNSLFGVLNCAMLPITFLYTSLGLLGYLKYGDDVKGSITLSLPDDEKLAQSVRVMLSIAIFFTHALCITPATATVFEEYVKPRVSKRLVLWEYITRVTLVLVAFVMAICVPYLDLFISLIGALCISMLGMLFPAIIQTCTFWHDYSGFSFTVFCLKNLTLALVAGYGLVFGVKITVEEMVLRFTQGE